MANGPADVAWQRGVRRLRAALGALWVVDGALQFQPFMFTHGFVTNVLAASAQGNAGFVFRPTTAIAHFVAPHIAIWNTLFATLQVALGLGIVVATTQRRWGALRYFLAASMVWSVLVWWLSEGLGGVLTGASPLAGAPGAVVLYAIIAVLVWPARRGEDGANAPWLGSIQARATWLVTWTLSGFLLLEPANQTRGAVTSLVAQAASGEPGFVHGLLTPVANFLSGSGPWLDSILALAMIGIGVGVALRLRARLLLVVSIALATVIWVFGEAFGGIFTGQGTDPNSGPLWILFALCMWVGLRQSSGAEATEPAATATVRRVHHDAVTAGATGAR